MKQSLAEYKLNAAATILEYELTALNDEIAARYQAELCAFARPDMRAFIEGIARFGSTCLDVGAAYGAQYFALKEHAPGVVWTGAEVAPQFIDKFEALCPLGEIPSVVQVSSYSSMIEFEDASFDVVTSRSALCYYSPEAGFEILEEMLRVARHAVIVKFYAYPSLPEDTYSERFGPAEGKGYYVDWALPKWEQFLEHKSIAMLSQNVVAILKGA